LRIRDNGRGFDPDDATAAAAPIDVSAATDATGEPQDAPKRGIGLRVMRHRAQMVGGELQIARGDSGGTIVACEFSA
jgi:signal transduction histidine kinase